MMYRVYFTSGETMMISEDRYLAFYRNTQTADGMEWKQYINAAHVTHILPEEQIAATDAVVTPKTPQQLRVDQEREESERPVTLDEQLANPEVGS